MKKLQNILQVVLIIVLIASCTKVVDVDVPNGGERLIVEASILWEKGTDGKNQTIYLNKSTSYFESSKINPAKMAEVSVKNNNTNETFVFNETEDGVYVCTNFNPELNQSYGLTITFENETIESTAILMPVPKIAEIKQEIESGFGDDQISVVVELDDPKGETNFYFGEMFIAGSSTPDARSTFFDDLSDGNRISEDFEVDELVAGDQVNIRINGISEAYFYYLELLLSQSEGGGGPFQSIPAKLIGNCINTTDSKKEVLGYFHLGETHIQPYTVK